MRTCAMFPFLVFAIRLPALCGEPPPPVEPDHARIAALVEDLTRDYSQRYTEAMKELAKLDVPVLLAVAERERAAKDRDVVNRLRAARWSALDQSGEKLRELVKQGPGKALLPMFVWDLRSATVFRRSYHEYQPADALRMIGAEAVPALIQALRIGQEPVPDLATAIREGKDPYARASAAKVLGEIGPVSAEIAPALEKLLRDREPHVREAAAWALGKMGAAAKGAVPSLVGAFRDTEATVGSAAADALGEIGGPALPVVTAALADKDVRVRCHAAQALGAMGSSGAFAVPNLVAALGDEDGLVRQYAATALGRIGPAAKAAAEALKKAYADDNPDIRQIGGKPLVTEEGSREGARLSDEERLCQCALTMCFNAAKSYWQVTGDAACVLPVVSSVLDSDYNWTRLLAANLLGEMGPAAEDAVPSLTAALLSTDAQLKLNAAIALGKIGSTGHGVVAALVGLLVEGEDYRDRCAAAKALSMLGPKAREAVPHLVRAMADRDHGVRSQAAEAMERIGPAAAGAVEDLARLYEHEDYEVRRNAAKVLGSIGGGAKEAVPELTELLEDPEPMVREAASAALDRIRKAPPGPRAMAEERFRRIVFELTVPLGEEAPFVAAEGRLVAFGSGHEVRVVDARTGETVHRRSLVPGEGKNSLAHEARVLGIARRTVYACVRHFADPERPDPGGGVMAIGGGPEPGSYELVAFDVDDPEVRQLGPLPSTAGLADALLGTSLVYTEEKSLHVVPLAGGEGRRFDLPGPALLRPVVRGDEVLGRYEGGLYAFREGGLTLVPFQDSPLASLTLEDHMEKAGDLVVACVGGETVACDLSGRLRWRAPVDGRVAAGPGGEIFVLGTTVCRLAPGDGRVVWRRYQAPDRFYWGARATFDRRLVAFGKTELLVYDLETGRLLLNLRQHRDLVRSAYNIFMSLVRMTSTGDTLVVGFEDRIIGVDLTPTAGVPAGLGASDPANALPQLEILSKLPTQRSRRAERLAEIGRDIADTPEAASEILPLVRELIWKEDGSPDETVVSAFHWLEDDVVLRAMGALVEYEALAEWKRIQVVEMLACRPETDRAVGVLARVAGDRKGFPVRLRSAAARHLRLLGRGPDVPAGDLRLLYATGHGAAVAEFRRRLLDGDAKARAAALELLAMAPDAVIAALEEELDKLPEGERAEGRKLVGEAKARLDAIAQTGHRD